MNSTAAPRRAPQQPALQEQQQATAQPLGDTIDEILAKTQARIDKLDKIGRDYRDKMSSDGLGMLSKAIVTGQGIQLMMHALDDTVMELFMPLMNTPLGFMTDRGPQARDDKNKAPYSRQEVRVVLCHALLNGVFPFGNEFNIIASRLYVTKEGYERKVREIPGLTDLRFSPGTPEQLTPHAHRMRARVTWNLDGVEQFLPDEKGQKAPCVFIIPSNSYLGPDGIAGKCKRKALKRVYEQINGSTSTAHDTEESEDVPLTALEQAKAALPAAAQVEAQPAAGVAYDELLRQIGEHQERLGLGANEMASVLAQVDARVGDKLTHKQADDLLTILAGLQAAEVR